MASQENQAAAETSRSEGNEFFKKKQVDEAIAAYTKSIDLSPDSSNAALCYSNRSACHQMKKNWKEMEADAAKCTKLKPTFAKGYTRLLLFLVVLLLLSRLRRRLLTSLGLLCLWGCPFRVL